METNFTHLHVHSTYTLLGSTANIDELIDTAVSQEYTQLALTDTNALYGAVSFSRKCKKAGIQPILGMVINTRLENAQGLGWVVLLATGPDGYRSLCKISSSIQGHPERETRIKQGVSIEDLAAHRSGLICISGGRRGWIEHFLREDNRQAAYQFAGRLANIFDQNLYLGLEIHTAKDRLIAKGIQEIGNSLGLKSVAVQPVFYLNSEDATRLRLLAAIDLNCKLSEVPQEILPNMGDSDVDCRWLSKEEVAARFSDFPDAVARVGEIVKQCHPALPDGKSIWPVLKLSQGQSPAEALEQSAKAGLIERFGPEIPQDVNRRLDMELEAITLHGYAPLFLVVADIVRFARQANLPVSTRGSVANSLVAYCAGITTVDPVEHELLFERFLNPARKDLPDIDLDFCSRRRDEVLEYVRRTYGADKVALVATVSTMQPRSAVRETAKALGLSEAEISHLAKLVPRRSRRSVSREDILAKVRDARYRDVIEQAFEIVGLPHHLSLHPGGVVITPCPTTDILPVQWSAKGFLIAQFDHRDVEAIGLPKLDLLGIRALTVLADSTELVRKYHDPSFAIEEIPPNDELAGDLLARGETIGVFQCESFGAIRTLRQIKARSIRDLAIANAYYRPGPLMGGQGDAFVERYQTEQEVSYLHPALESILGSTKGVLIFQEQILRVARDIAGLTWEQADRLRRGINRYRSEEMEEVEDLFIEGCQRPEPEGHGLTKEQAQQLWEQVVAFSGFGFNQGHATAYAAVSYRSAYVKAHWPAAFLCARLADRGGYHHPAIYMAEARRLGMHLKPPHINQSNAKFTLTWGTETNGQVPCLWMGLDAVRDLRQHSIREIIKVRENSPFVDVRDVAARVDLQTKELVHLIQCGGLDGLGQNRATMIVEAEAIKRGGTEKQMAFAFTETKAASESSRQVLAWEMQVLGCPMSVHPLDLHTELPDHLPLKELDRVERQRVSIVGVRLPGWTGGRGFFFGDRENYIIVRKERGRGQPPTWEPQLLHGQWQNDGMGTSWLQAESAVAL